MSILTRLRWGTAAVVALACALASPRPAAGAQETERTIADTATSAQKDLEAALQELSALRETIAREKMPLTRDLRDKEQELSRVRAEHEETRHQLDTRNLELNGLRNESKGREEEVKYLSSLLDEYVRNLEARLHISELQRYGASLEAARTAPENGDLAPARVFDAQLTVVRESVDRLLDLVGGATFEGQGIDVADGKMQDVTFTLIGPVAVYRTADGTDAGLAEQRLGSLEPNLIPFEEAGFTAHAKDLVATGHGRLPLDPTLGNAHKVEATNDTLVQHVAKGGPVMIPILLLAAAALIVGLVKWVQLTRVRTPSRRRVEAFLASLKAGNFPAVARDVKALPGPTGEMLRAGVDHLHEPKELVEEVMFERMLETRLRLQSYLPFVAVSAAAAPLLGLLGTVTGIINTFKLITVFGTGDAKTLSGGISEALITTEFGLIVAIPSLLLHAYLSRRARRLTNGMEKTAVAFLNRMPQLHEEPRAQRLAAAGGARPERAMPGLPVPEPVEG